MPARTDTPLLRLATAGSVDDGKSTLIGRLLFDTRNILDDQLAAIEQASRRRGSAGVELALLTDGLRAEREQNITIDVAYRHFATPARRFIIADTPGHVQYTRNMVTGASTADLAIVLVDARRGVRTQARRHGFIAALLGLPHLVVAVNKMDLAGYDEAAFRSIVDDYRRGTDTLRFETITFIPISALHGDNIVNRSERMPWYTGRTLLEHLETVPVAAAGDGSAGFRLPVQYVIRPHQDFRGIAGRIASGTVRAGDDVVILPRGERSRVRTIEAPDGPLALAHAGENVVLTLADDIDVGRGDQLAAVDAAPHVGTRLRADLCWMDATPLATGSAYVLLHASSRTRAVIEHVESRFDPEMLRCVPAGDDAVALNDIAHVEVVTAQPVVFDRYDHNRTTGSFVLVDEVSNATVAAGMIRGAAAPRAAVRTPTDAQHDVHSAPDDAYHPLSGHQRHHGAVIWLTGHSGAGKSTIAGALDAALRAEGRRVVLLDGDALREGLCSDLGYGAADRSENLRRAGEVARLFFDSGAIVVCAFIAPDREDRRRVRARFPAGRFLEVHVHADIATCIERDPKGHYARALAGELSDFTGVDAPYEAPLSPELRIDTTRTQPADAAAAIVAALRRGGVLDTAFTPAGAA